MLPAVDKVQIKYILHIPWNTSYFRIWKSFQRCVSISGSILSKILVTGRSLLQFLDESIQDRWAYEGKLELDVCLSMHRCICVEKKNQLDVTEWFIALIICSTCFGHFYAHHQELETICVLLPPMVCDALVAGCWRSGAGQQAMHPGWGMLRSNIPYPDA
jgi:hypothetical protein